MTISNRHTRVIFCDLRYCPGDSGAKKKPNYFCAKISWGIVLSRIMVAGVQKFQVGSNFQIVIDKTLKMS